MVLSLLGEPAGAFPRCDFCAFRSIKSKKHEKQRAVFLMLTVANVANFPALFANGIAMAIGQVA